MSILDATMRTIRHLKINLKSVLVKSRILFLFVKIRRLLLTAFTVFTSNTLPPSDIMSNKISIICCNGSVIPILPI